MIIDAHAHAYGPDAVGPVAKLQVERTIAYGPTSMEKKPGQRPRAWKGVVVFFVLTLGAFYVVLWGRLALFQIPAVTLVTDPPSQNRFKQPRKE